MTDDVCTSVSNKLQTFLTERHIDWVGNKILLRNEDKREIIKRNFVYAGKNEKKKKKYRKLRGNLNFLTSVYIYIQIYTNDRLTERGGCSQII